MTHSTKNTHVQNVSRKKTKTTTAKKSAWTGEKKTHKYAGKKGKEKITTMNTKKAVKTFAWIFYTHKLTNV